jgi:UDP-glucose 4-epimerase
MRVLVTGGAGFIGSHVVDRLIAEGHEVRVFDLVHSPYHDGRVEHALGDLEDLEGITVAMEGCDAAIHLAAVADVNHVVADPGRAHSVNATGTLNVLEAARRAGTRRIVYGSTIWVYSDCAETAVDEDTQLAPPSHLYTSTKLTGELYCRSYTELYGLEHTILRFGIPYGPRAREATVLAAFCKKAEAGEELTVAGDGSQSRRFIYVEDLAEAVVAGLAPQAANRTYNAAGEEATTILEIAEAVRDHVADTGIVHTESRNADFGGKEVSSERAWRELGWRPTTSFAEGFARYVGWRRAQRARRRVLVLTADIGEGHDLPARSLAADLAGDEAEVEVEVIDGLRAMGRVMTAIVRDNSWALFNWAPWLFAIQYFVISTFPPTRWIAMRFCYVMGGRRLRREIEARHPDVVVSTYPGTTAVLGELRRRGRIDVPVVSVITDLAGLRYWAHPGIDLHTVTHPESVEEVERIAGPGSVRAARPPSSPEFLEPRAPAAARSVLGLPAAGPIVAVSGGGWGIGDLTGAVEAALEIPEVTVVALTGHNPHATRRLEDRFGTDGRVRILGFTDRMSDLLAAADVLVHSTAGLTVLEAQIRGCPVVSYGFAVGHIRANNRAYRRFGLATVATSRRELGSQIRAAMAADHAPDESFTRLPSVAELVLGAEPRARRFTRLRLRIARVAIASTVGVFLASAALLSDDFYPLLARAFNAAPIRKVDTSRPEVGLLVDAPAGSAVSVARRLDHHGMTASFALEGAPTARSLRLLRSHGDEAIPRLDSGGPFHSLETKDRLSKAAQALRLSGDFIYRPGSGFTLSQYVLARRAGGSPVAGDVRVSSGTPVSVTAGDVVELEPPAGEWHPAVGALQDELEASGLRAVSVSALMRSAHH